MTSSTSSVPVPSRRRVFPKVELSATQVVATGFAGVTATFLASYLGVTGTILGAAVVSMATAIGNAVYGQSLRSTRDKVRDAVPFAGRVDPASPTAVLPAAGEDADEDDAGEVPALPAKASSEQAAELMPARAWRRVAFVAVGMFAALLAVVTSVELLAGRPLADVVRGDSGHGTSIGGGGSNSGGGGGAVPTTTVTVTPKVVVTTPTVTQTATPATTTKTAPTPTTTTTPATTSGTGTTTAPSSAPTSSQTLPRPGE